VDELLTIGEFSQACGLSARVLRSYAGSGLLPPVAVDRWTGYRYYAPVQIQQAKVIGLLRQAGMPLLDIAGLLTDPAPARLDAWDRSLGRELASRRQALAAARHELGALPPDLPPPSAAELPDQLPGHLVAGAASAKGPARDVNQDAVLAAGDLAAVADGLGPAGRTGSLLAVEVLCATLAAGASPVGACQAANAAIWRHTGDGAEAAMGATLTAVTRAGSALSLVHVGDSRAYLLHDRTLRQLTEDHTLVAGLVRAGELTEDAARHHPQRALLTRALGTGPGIEPFSATITFAPGDRLLLCTDGVTSVLTGEQITAVLADPGPPAEAAAGLVQVALAHGGQDDTSAVVAEVAPRDAEAAPPERAATPADDAR
jgi:serine/threonine protein phosphatase PrpC/DNA-binding transcriptional MerR regulator